MKKLFSITLLLGLMLLAETVCFGQNDVDGLKEIIAIQNEKIEELSARIAALEASGTTVTTSRVTEDIKKPEWTDRLTMNGDFRYRFETVKQDGKKNRIRNRIRVRTGIDAKLSDNAMVGFQLASGAGDPGSNNQTLDDGFSNKNITITRAFLNWNSNEYSFYAGKMRNMFVVPGGSELVWFTDINPEGLFLSWKKDSLFTNLAGYWVDERSSDADSGILGAQIGTRLNTGKQTKLLIAASYYDFINAKGKATFYDPANSFGNSVTATGEYANDYNEFGLSAEYSFIVGGEPAGLFFDFVKNTATGDNDKGWLFGYQMGKCKDPGSADYKIYYKHLESDAVVGIFADSDFHVGGTNNRGLEFNMGYQASPVLKAAFSYFMNESNLLANSDYNKLQLDMYVKF